VWNGGWTGEFIKPNGPGTKNVFDMDAAGTQVWVASGGYRADWGKRYMIEGIFSSNEGIWTTHNRFNTPAFDSISDYVSAKVDPANPDIAYIGTWGGGLLKFTKQELTTVYDEYNSSLQPWTSAPSLTLVSGIDFDSNHNLWVANSGAPNLLSVMKSNGEWKSFNMGGGLSGLDISKLMVDSYNQKWMIKRSDGFVIVFTDNNTPDDPTDDKSKVLRSAAGQGKIPGNKLYSFATDLDGEVWVGTDKGVAVFYTPENIFATGVNYDAQQILVPRNDGSGLADILLETELVTAIAIDGANRKWIGTERSGAFLLSPDGQQELHHFTADNSPLLSNQIISISIDQNGEVYMGTAQGLISYKGTATPPNPPGSKVYAYPNPVRETYHGDIAIKGLVSDSYIKITDTYGNLVYETRSEGGQAIWDGKNFDGRDVATGIYMVFAFTEDKTEKIVTKILVVR
jgi:frataxin-like iron-binding protein CyaY